MYQQKASKVVSANLKTAPKCASIDTAMRRERGREGVSRRIEHSGTKVIRHRVSWDFEKGAVPRPLGMTLRLDDSLHQQATSKGFMGAGGSKGLWSQNTSSVLFYDEEPYIVRKFPSKSRTKCILSWATIRSLILNSQKVNEICGLEIRSQDLPTMLLNFCNCHWRVYFMIMIRK